MSQTKLLRDALAAEAASPGSITRQFVFDEAVKIGVEIPGKVKTGKKDALIAFVEGALTKLEAEEAAELERKGEQSPGADDGGEPPEVTTLRKVGPGEVVEVGDGELDEIDPDDLDPTDGDEDGQVAEPEVDVPSAPSPALSPRSASPRAAPRPTLPARTPSPTKAPALRPIAGEKVRVLGLQTATIRQAKDVIALAKGHWTHVPKVHVEELVRLKFIKKPE